MPKVKAQWEVGYPAGPDRKIYSDGDVFTCDDKWGKKKAAEGKVSILEEIKKEEIIKITDMTVDEAEEIIEKCEDIKQLESWLKEEKDSKNRKTAIEYLNDRLDELRE